MTTHIVGAGMAGLLAANMLRNSNVFERQSKLPNNHSAVLRFRSGQIGDLTGIPFKRVTMIKGVVPWLNPIADALAYSRKTNKTYRSDRSIIAGLTQAERFIAPPDFISRLASNVGSKIVLGHDYDFSEVADFGNPVVSTVPMPILMDRLQYPPLLNGKLPVFRSEVGYNLSATIADCDAYISLTIPNPDARVSRISITGDRMVVEIMPPDNLTEIDEWLEGIKAYALKQAQRYAWEYLGINSPVFDVGVNVQAYGKIAPVPEDVRKAFMYWATDNFNIYSLGRYATWRPGLLLDDLVQDVRRIEGWIGSGSKYDVAARR